jgi:phosphohistidine phosphatase
MRSASFGFVFVNGIDYAATGDGIMPREPRRAERTDRSMKSLLLLRHAKSSWKHPELADHDRPLNKRGKRDAPRMGRLVRDEDLVPELILSSSALRARETALAVAAACDHACELRVLRELYLAEPEDHALLLQSLPDAVDSAMLVGHNPGMEELVEALGGEHETMPTAALAWIDLPIDRWPELRLDGSGRLRALWLPRKLD